MKNLVWMLTLSAAFSSLAHAEDSSSPFDKAFPEKSIGHDYQTFLGVTDGVATIGVGGAVGGLSYLGYKKAGKLLVIADASGSKVGVRLFKGLKVVSIGGMVLGGWAVVDGVLKITLSSFHRNSEGSPLFTGGQLLLEPGTWEYLLNEADQE